jgi:hypothetical protein
MPPHVNPQGIESYGRCSLWKSVEFITLGKVRTGKLPVLLLHDEGFSRDVLDAGHGRSRAHRRGDHDDQFLDHDCPGEYRASRF